MWTSPGADNDTTSSNVTGSYWRDSGNIRSEMRPLDTSNSGTDSVKKSDTADRALQLE